MYSDLKYTKRLEMVGFTRKQAEETVNFMSDSIQNLATKDDLKALDLKWSDRFDQHVRLIDEKMNHLETRLTLKLGAMMLTMTLTSMSISLGYLKFLLDK
jgi:hypothetical protein